MSLRHNYWFCCFGGSTSTEKLGFLGFLSIFWILNCQSMCFSPLERFLCSVILQVACARRCQKGFLIARVAGMCW